MKTAKKDFTTSPMEIRSHVTLAKQLMLAKTYRINQRYATLLTKLYRYFLDKKDMVVGDV